MRDGKRWRRLVEAHVDFLDDLGFQLAAVEAESWWWVSVTYSNAASAIRFTRDFESEGCEVDLGRLVDGRVPPRPIWVSAEPITWVPLDTVLEVRAPGLLKQARRLRGLEADELGRQLTFWVEATEPARCGCGSSTDFVGGHHRGVARAPRDGFGWLPQTRRRYRRYGPSVVTSSSSIRSKEPTEMDRCPSPSSR